jgi:hypothetical protein
LRGLFSATRLIRIPLQIANAPLFPMHCQ